jgi:hypothetical protein
MRRSIVFTVLLVLSMFRIAGATPNDTTWVRTFDSDFYNWATPHDATFTFPDGSTPWKHIVMRYTIGCPSAPNDCDPWDRIGYTQILRDTGEVDGEGNPILETVEIARIITPYDITGGSRPGTCTWEIDVSDYESLLVGDVTLRNYIESWIGGDDGWLVTIDFGFVEGEWYREPVEVINLWTDYRLVHGDPARPVEDILAPRMLDIPLGASEVKIRTFATGHGQGNTSNCSEFCPRSHTLTVNGDETSHILWRSDCSANSCSPQGGTWTFPRAGWCPGDKADAWEVDVTGSVSPGGTAALDYDLQPYENFCRPDNPECIPGVTCPDCNYNFNGHTEPHFSLASQLIVYEAGPFTGTEDTVPARADALGQNSPNPFNPTTWIGYEVATPGSVELRILDAGGRIVRTLRRHHGSAGDYRLRWDGRDEAGEAVASGVFFYELWTDGGRVGGRKMVLLR